MFRHLLPHIWLHHKHGVMKSDKSIVIPVDVINDINIRSNKDVDNWIDSFDSFYSGDSIYPATGPIIKNELNMFYNSGTVSDSLRQMLSADLPSDMKSIIDDEIQILTRKSEFSSKLDLQNITDVMIQWFADTLKFSRMYLLIRNQYPQYILDPKYCPWTWNDVGGIKAHIRIIFSSFGQYIAFYYTPIPFTGNSGIYDMRVYDIMKSGLMTSNGTNPIDFMPREFKPGDISDLEPHTSRTYNMRAPDGIRGAGMIDVGVGNIIAAFNEGIIKPMFADSDYRAGLQQLKEDLIAVGKYERSKCSIL